MVSRLLSALDARIARTRDPLQNDCLRAERATLLARQGRLDEARAELDRIRARHAAKPNAVVTAWVCLGEGMVVYYGSLGIAARDRFLRALALSEAAHARRVVALSAAWLAQMDFATQDFAALSRHLPHALKYAEPDQHSALSRACLVAAEAFHWAERFDLAMPWYARARHHATSEGDESMLSALMHNMAWLRVAEYRRREVAGELGHAEARQAKLSAESIAQFDGMVGIVSLGSLVPMLRAQVLILEEQYKEALALLEANAEAFLHQGLERLACAVNADIAWCRLRCGDSGGARQSARLATSRLLPTTHADDRALTHARIARIWHELGESGLADSHETSAAAAWQLHMLQQAQLVPTLEEVLEGL